MDLNGLAALVGAETGLVKRVKFSRVESRAPVRVQSENVNKASHESREAMEIVSVCPIDPNNVLIGRKDGTLLTFQKKSGVIMDDAQTRIVKDSEKAPTQLLKLCAFGERSFAAFTSGCVTSVEDEPSTLFQAVPENSKSKASLSCARIDVKTGRMALGGRRIDLQVWDLAMHSTPVFAAKKPGLKTLVDVPVVTAVNDVEFFPGGPELLSACEDGKIRVYDPRVQRKPLREFADPDEAPVRVVKLIRGGQAIICGTSSGRLRTFDMRKKLTLASNFKQVVGAVRDFDVFRCEESGKAVIASVGLGRWLHLHDLESAALLEKVYLKSCLNCVHVYRDSSDS